MHVAVLFWHVARQDNADAEKLATDAFGTLHATAGVSLP